MLSRKGGDSFSDFQTAFRLLPVIPAQAGMTAGVAVFRRPFCLQGFKQPAAIYSLPCVRAGEGWGGGGVARQRLHGGHCPHPSPPPQAGEGIRRKKKPPCRNSPSSPPLAGERIRGWSNLFGLMSQDGKRVAGSNIFRLSDSRCNPAKIPACAGMTADVAVFQTASHAQKGNARVAHLQHGVGFQRIVAVKQAVEYRHFGGVAPDDLVD
ncbi:Uncharacterised protein [Kingella potus]|uniref:Uncharacterized protein n=1 Tax=Kingella potus TaxID=265175 RepID=A0A377QYY4_9NEIS|nr:Uncharacterised protein [Kingella potus]